MTMHELILKAQDQLVARLEKNIETLAMLGERISFLEEEGVCSGKETMILYALLQQRAFGLDHSISLERLAEHIGVGTQMTRKYLAALEARGVVRKTRGRSPLKFAVADGFLAECGIELQP